MTYTYATEGKSPLNSDGLTKSNPQLLEKTWICKNDSDRNKTLEDLEALSQQMSPDSVAIVLEPLHWSYTSTPLNKLITHAKKFDLTVDIMEKKLDKNGKPLVRDSFFMMHNTSAALEFLEIWQRWQIEKKPPAKGHPTLFSSLIAYYSLNKLPKVGNLLNVGPLQFPLPLTWHKDPLSQPIITAPFQRLKIPAGESIAVSPSSESKSILSDAWICENGPNIAETLETLFQKMSIGKVVIVLGAKHWSQTSTPLDKFIRYAKKFDFTVDIIEDKFDKNGKPHIRDGFFVAQYTPSAKEFISILQGWEDEKSHPVEGHPTLFSSLIAYYSLNKLPKVGAPLNVGHLQFPLPLTYHETPLPKPLITSPFQRLKEINSSLLTSSPAATSADSWVLVDDSSTTTLPPPLVTYPTGYSGPKPLYPVGSLDSIPTPKGYQKVTYYEDGSSISIGERWDADADTD